MIEAINLTKKFDKFTALNSISCTIKPGSMFGLVGSNGSGKSTLLRLIAGIYYPDGGKIQINGQNIFNNSSIKSSIFFMPDTPYFIHQSNLNEMARFYSNIYNSFSFERFNYLTTVFPIDPKKRIQTMSKGMQRQAALMLALSTLPEYLLLDEAFDGLDPVIRQVLKQLVANGIAEQNLTVISASHNLRELEDLCDHVGLLHKGDIIFNDELDTLKGNLHKIQIAFSMIPDQTALCEMLDVVKIERQGSLLNMVIRGDQDEIITKLKRFDPLFIEALPPTLEEIFIYELEVAGYDVRNIIG